MEGLWYYVPVSVTLLGVGGCATLGILMKCISICWDSHIALLSNIDPGEVIHGIL